MSREWFPMSDAHLVRDGRHIELRPARPQRFESEKARKDYDGSLRTFIRTDASDTKYVIGHWSDRQWILNPEGDMEGGSCWDLIDDHFTGWRNLEPVYPDNADPDAPCLVDRVNRMEGRLAALEVLAMERTASASRPSKDQP